MRLASGAVNGVSYVRFSENFTGGLTGRLWVDLSCLADWLESTPKQPLVFPGAGV